MTVTLEGPNAAPPQPQTPALTDIQVLLVKRTTHWLLADRPDELAFQTLVAELLERLSAGFADLVKRIKKAREANLIADVERLCLEYHACYDDLTRLVVEQLHKLVGDGYIQLRDQAGVLRVVPGRNFNGWVFQLSLPCLCH